MQVIKEVIKAIQNITENSISSEIEYSLNSGQDSRTWDFTEETSSSKIKIDQLGIKSFEKIMKNSSISFADLKTSLELDEDLEDFRKRIIIDSKDKSFLYYTKDFEFIVKSITPKELMCFNSIRDEYTNRICSSEGSYLTKIFALFKVNVEGSNVMRVLIMENLSSRMNNPIKFKLNGSLGTKIDSLRQSTHDIGEISREFLYNDKDFVELIGSFNINNTELLSIIGKIKRDTKALASNLLVEYELVVMTEQSTSLKSTMIERNFIAGGGNFVVFIAIDNFLQVFCAQRKMTKQERRVTLKFFKMQEYCPQSYRKRFLYMVKSIFRPQSVN